MDHPQMKIDGARRFLVPGPIKGLMPQVLFSVLGLVLWYFVRGSYGISWDQTVDLGFGEAVWNYFASQGDYSFIRQYPVENLTFYSPLVPLGANALSKIFGADLFLCGAALTGLFWVGTFWPVCRIAGRIGGPGAACLAGLALLATPVYMGHGFINAKDLPFACTTAWFLLAVSWACERRGFRWSEALATGAAFGGVLAVRPGGFFVGAIFALPLLAHAGLPWGGWTRARKVRLAAVFLWLLLALLLAWAIMVLPWPSAHRNPIWHPVESMLLASRFNETYPVMFLGKQVPSSSLPWSYFLVYFGVTIPVFILLGALVGQARAIKLLISRQRMAATAGLLFLIWFPMTLFIVMRMNVYDGIRHFLFIVPLLAISAGVGGAWLAARMPEKWGPWRLAAVAMAYAASLPSLATLHPYQYAYYNILAGPRSTIHQRFETDYWVTSYREAAEWINQQPLGSPRVVVAANAFCEPAFTHFAQPRVQILSAMGNFLNSPWPDQADFYVGTVRYMQSENFSRAPVAIRVERGGILMSVIRKAP